MNANGFDADDMTPGARRILDTASALFYEQGITTVGVDRIAAESGVTKRTLYDRFGSKDALVATYLLQRDRNWRATVNQALATADSSGYERLLAPFTALKTWTDQNHRGCAFINALAELPDSGHPGHRIAADEKHWLYDLFHQLSVKAGAGDPAELARRLLLLHEGALATQPVVRIDSAGTAYRAAQDLLRTAGIRRC